MVEKFQELREMAKRKIQIADHMITQTYPLVGDPKLLMTTLENVFLAMTNSMGAVLHYERLFKRIPPFEDNFDSKYNMFQNRLAEKLRIEKKYTIMIRDLKDIIIQHRKSPIEFSRKDKFIICNDEYRMKTVSVNDIKGYIKNAKEFVSMMNNITAKNEELFRGQK